MSTLEDVFSNEKVEEVSEEVTAEAESEIEEKVETEDAEEIKEEAAEESKKEVEEPTSTEEEQEEKQEWTFQAVKDERRKRQEIEKQKQELEKQLEELKDSKAEMPDIFEDQAAFVKSLQDQQYQQLNSQRIEMSRQIMMETKDDYEEVEALFIEAAKDNPVMRDNAAKSPFPAKYVYEQGRKYQDFQKMQNLDEYKQSLKAELRKELESEFKQAAEAKAKKGKNLSPSLANARASDNDAKVIDMSLESLFSR